MTAHLAPLVLALCTLLLPISEAQAVKIVMIGDSITCGPFGEKVFKNLELGGKNSVVQYCMIGSAPNHWIQGRRAVSACQSRISPSAKLVPCPNTAPTLDAILKRDPKAHVIVALGTNSMVGPQIDGNYKAMAEKIAKGQHTCEWILPPNMNPSQSKGWKPGHVRDMQGRLGSIIGQIKAAVNNSKTTRCLTIDSRAATAVGTKGSQTTDGVHRTKDAGYDWADAINSELLKSLNANERPANAASPANR